VNRRNAEPAAALVALALALCAAPVSAAPSVHTRLPAAPARFLYDGAGVLSRDERRVIEDTLMAFDRRGLEIGVAIFKSIDGDAIEDVALALAETWKPGNAERDNGALIVIALEERAMRIEVGYGLEPVIPDGVAGRIIRRDMTPAFRAGRFGDGIAAALTSLASAARGEIVPEPESTGAPPWLALVIIGVVLVFILGVAHAGRRGWITHGGFDSRWGGRGMYGGTHRRGGGPWWSTGGGGGFGGGGGSSGGSFGGGSFGGGGASGSW
jgi:uncharacterized protein